MRVKFYGIKEREIPDLHIWHEFINPFVVDNKYGWTDPDAEGRPIFWLKFKDTEEYLYAKLKFGFLKEYEG